MKPFNDKVKVKIKKAGPFGNEAAGAESGTVVEVPDSMIYFGFHSFLADTSLANEVVLTDIINFYKKLEGKVVFWESLQDRGRRFKENDEEFVLLNMSDIIAYTDDENHNITTVDQTGASGSFNLQ